MLESPDWIGRTYTSTVGWNVLYDLTEIGSRLGASEGERRGHERVAEAFDSLGVRDDRVRGHRASRLAGR